MWFRNGETRGSFWDTIAMLWGVYLCRRAPKRLRVVPLQLLALWKIAPTIPVENPNLWTVRPPWSITRNHHLRSNATNSITSRHRAHCKMSVFVCCMKTQSNSWYINFDSRETWNWRSNLPRLRNAVPFYVYETKTSTREEFLRHFSLPCTALVGSHRAKNS